jgi:hypothetical protein
MYWFPESESINEIHTGTGNYIQVHADTVIHTESYVIEIMHICMFFITKYKQIQHDMATKCVTGRYEHAGSLMFTHWLPLDRQQLGSWPQAALRVRLLHSGEGARQSSVCKGYAGYSFIVLGIFCISGCFVGCFVCTLSANLYPNTHHSHLQHHCSSTSTQHHFHSLHSDLLSLAARIMIPCP